MHFSRVVPTSAAGITARFQGLLFNSGGTHGGYTTMDAHDIVIH